MPFHAHPTPSSLLHILYQIHDERLASIIARSVTLCLYAFPNQRILFCHLWQARRFTVIMLPYCTATLRFLIFCRFARGFVGKEPWKARMWGSTRSSNTLSPPNYPTNPPENLQEVVNQTSCIASVPGERPVIRVSRSSAVMTKISDSCENIWHIHLMLLGHPISFI